MRNTMLMGVALCVLPLCAQNTRILSADKANEYGIVYALPETQLHIDLTATFTERVAGPYRQYAPRYLGNVDVVHEDSRSCELTDISLTTTGVAGEQKYLMTVKSGATTTICVAPDGMILAINTDVDYNPPAPPEQPETAERPDMDEYLRFVDEEFLVSLSDAKKAQMLAQTIMDIRESRLSLSRGTAETMPTDGRQLELMLQSLQQQENALMRAFTGYEYTHTERRRITLTPDSTMLSGTNTVIARLSPGERFSSGDDLVGEPIYMSVNITASPEMPVNAKGEPKTMPKDAVAYRLPSTAVVKVEYDGRNMLTQEVYLAQGGEVFGLDPKLFTDKKAPSCAIFDPATGAIETVRPVSSAVQ